MLQEPSTTQAERKADCDELDESTGDFRNGSCFRHRTTSFIRTGGSDAAPSSRAQQALSTASQPVSLVFLTHPNLPKPLIPSSSEYALPSSQPISGSLSAFQSQTALPAPSVAHPSSHTMKQPYSSHDPYVFSLFLGSVSLLRPFTSTLNVL